MLKTCHFADIGDMGVGHAQDYKALTGCTVVIFEKGATAAVDVRGGAPGTRETDLLKPANLVQKIHAVLLTGGSAFGLDAAAGVMQYLEEEKIGFDMRVARVPIVCAAVLFDLAVADAGIRPDNAMGFQACANSRKNSSRQGNIGAGTGASVGKLMGMQRAMKGGLGHFALQHGDIKIGALVAVNCLGDVIDCDTKKILAGLRTIDGKSCLNTEKIIIEQQPSSASRPATNTTIGVVVTNANLNKTDLNRLAAICQNGIARSTSPAHTLYDGDTLFALSCGNVDADPLLLETLGVKVVEKAIQSAIKTAQGVDGLPAHADLNL